MWPAIQRTIRLFLAEEDGQGLAEYALIMVLVSIIAMAALNAMGLSVIDILNEVNNTLTAISSS